MELPAREDGDRLLQEGECVDIRRRLGLKVHGRDLTAVVIGAFDHRTRILPFYYSAKRMAPAGPRAIGAALYDCGIVNTRVVLQQWNPRVTPSRLRIDGRVPDMLLISSMKIHTAACQSLIREACSMDESARPLVMVGGPLTIYEPWEAFSSNPQDPWSADVAVRGEEYVLMNMLEVLLDHWIPGQSLRAAFRGARDDGSLADVPGLMYAARSDSPVADELVQTSVQRLVADLDELPHPTLGYRLLERPSRSRDIAARPMEPREIRRHTPIGSLILTAGCRFSCPYCPIPAYNQREHRFKSPARIADEMVRLNRELGLRYFFGTDDNFFNDRRRSLEILETLAATKIDGRPLRRRVRWGTEVTMHDTLAMKEHLPLVRKAGAMILWMGVEDITATFVKKGQSVSKIKETFALLRQNGLLANPMLMHHEGQPLWSRGSSYGLLNQVRLLRKAGAIDVQVLTMTPAVGSRSYESAFESGQMIDSAAGRSIQPYMLDANYVVTGQGEQPWKMQLRVLATLCYQYNPLGIIRALLRPRSRMYLIDVGVQIVGLAGLLRTAPRMLSWAWRMIRGPIIRSRRVPSASAKITFASDLAVPSASVGERH